MEKELHNLRYLAFLVCFGLSYSVYLLTQVESKPPMPVVQKSEIRSTKPHVAPTPVIDRKGTVLEYTGAQTLDYNSYTINNTERGLSVSRKGKRLIFLKNAFIDGEYGEFELRRLLNNDRKQLVYLSRTGGNHCCAYYQIVDLAKDRPRKIFDSEDYDVQMTEGDENDWLMTFDHDNDGRLEITQKTTYGAGWGCAQVANPVIYVGFIYSEKYMKYVPMKTFAPSEEARIKERKRNVEADNLKIENNQLPETINCGYEPDIAAIALSYIYQGREREGLKYIRKNYRTLDFSSRPFRFDKKHSDRMAAKTISDLKRTLLHDKLYKAIYNR